MLKESRKMFKGDAIRRAGLAQIILGTTRRVLGSGSNAPHSFSGGKFRVGPDWLGVFSL